MPIERGVVGYRRIIRVINAAGTPKESEADNLTAIVRATLTGSDITVTNDGTTYFREITGDGTDNSLGYYIFELTDTNLVGLETDALIDKALFISYSCSTGDRFCEPAGEHVHQMPKWSNIKGATFSSSTDKFTDIRTALETLA
jgi:hypothetical protein